ncbi:Protein C2-DOMAIN ABA-RELATED 4 [Asimina triloba]
MHLLGLLRVHVVKGTNLAIRDVRTSDPYAVLKMGKQKLKTGVMKKNVNPEWNEILTFSIADPTLPIKLTVYDKDRFSQDDKMGEVEFSIEQFVEAVRMNFESNPSGTIISTVEPTSRNCLCEESHIMWMDGKVIQDLRLRLQNVECGEVELQLEWIKLPGSRHIGIPLPFDPMGLSAVELAYEHQHSKLFGRENFDTPAFCQDDALAARIYREAAGLIILRLISILSVPVQISDGHCYGQKMEDFEGSLAYSLGPRVLDKLH